MDVHQSLTAFIEKFCAQVDESKRQIEFDADWPSPCVQEQEPSDQACVTWTPVRQQPQQTFANVESALEVTIHADVKAFYTCFWSENLPAVAKDGDCELLQPWNQADFDRLQENIIGHVLMKRRLRQSLTCFIGLTDEEDFILSVDNTSGAVVLEQVGCDPSRVIAPSIPLFLQQIKPRIPANVM